MRNKFTAFGLTAITTAVMITACGGSSDTAASDGGSSSNNNTPSFAGNYKLDLALTTNTCPASLSTNGAPATSISVAQDGNNIVVGKEPQVLRGTVDADKAGFTTSMTQTVGTTKVVGEIRFRSTATQGVYDVTYNFIPTQCLASWTGKGTKI